MEFHLSRIPAHLTHADLKSALTLILHSETISAAAAADRTVRDPPRTKSKMNFWVHIWKNKGQSTRPLMMGWLRVPILAVAKKFEEVAKGQVLVSGWAIQVNRSHRTVQPELYLMLLGEEFVSVEEEERRRKALKANEVPVDVKRVATGGQLWGNVFKCEWEREAVGEKIQASFDGERRTLDIVIGIRERGPNPTTITIAFDSIASISSLVPLARSPTPSILLSLFRPPVLSSPNAYPVHRNALRERHSTLPGNKSLAPVLYLLITLPNSATLKSFFDKAPRSKLPSVITTSCLKVIRYQASDVQRQERDVKELAALLRSVDVRVAFQVESLCRNGTLSVEQILFFKGKILALVEEVGISDAEKVLQVFGGKIVRSGGVVDGTVGEGGEVWQEWESKDDKAVRLPQHLRDFERIEDIKDSRGVVATADIDHRQRGSDNAQLLHFLTTLKNQIPSTSSTNGPRIRASETTTRLALITASSFYLTGPSIDESNSVLRRFPGNEHYFLRVSVKDEDFTRYRFDRTTNLPHFLSKRYMNIFTAGLQLGGRNFEFLGYSGSALKEHSAWFVTPFFDANSTLITAESIRSSLGDFSKVIHFPARYMARVSQAFTSTQPSVTLKKEQVRQIPDRESRWVEQDDFGDELDSKTSCFTDGVGTISVKLAKEIEVALTQGMSEAGKKRRGKPTTYQIRLGGSKGMVGIDPRLSGSVICLRPSMTKFDAPDSLTLDIAASFSRPLPAYLNRPLIKILEDLGIPAFRFLKLQREAVQDVVLAREEPLAASRLFNRLGLAASTDFLGTFKSIQKRYSLNMLGEDAFVTECAEVAVVHSLRDLKFKSRVPLPGSYTLVGIADESPRGGFLDEGEIYAAIKRPGSSETIYLKGPVAISRSPTVHPGDVQIVKAVGRLLEGEAPALSIHTNTIIFSVKGQRSLPSCLGGGDLDGDLYHLITDPNLIPLPRMVVKPASYHPAEIFRLNQPCTIRDGADFFLKFIVSDIVGIIANQHLLIADQAANGTKDEACMLLADLHSRAVDYPKSGKPVLAEEMPKARAESKPDFMSAIGTKSYPSSKALGQLFRDISPADLILRSFNPHGDASSQSLDPGRSLTDAMATTPLQNFSRGLGTLKISDSLRNSVNQILVSYAEDTFAIGQQNVHARRSDRHLSEAEVFLGTIADTSKMDRAGKEVLEKLRIQTEAHFSKYQEMLIGGDGTSKKEQIRRAWTGWKVALESDQTEYGVKSFAWMAMSLLLDLTEAE